MVSICILGSHHPCQKAGYKTFGASSAHAAGVELGADAGPLVHICNTVPFYPSLLYYLVHTSSY